MSNRKIDLLRYAAIVKNDNSRTFALRSMIILAQKYYKNILPLLYEELYRERENIKKEVDRKIQLEKRKNLPGGGLNN